MNKFYKGLIIFTCAFSTLLLTLLIFPHEGPQKISLSKYKKYDQYGLQYTDIEAECLNFLANTLDSTLITLSYEENDYQVFTLEDLEAPFISKIKEQLPLCKEIKAITTTLFTDPSSATSPYQFDITYLPHDGSEILLSYHSDGTCTKYFVEGNKTIALSGLWRGPKSIDAEIIYK